jgi:hypothetical protein
MTHRFLVESGRWTLEGQWLEPNFPPIIVKGATAVAWSQDNWFSLATKILFPGGERPEITCQSRGRLNQGQRQYTYILQQSWLGKAEGEGWIAADSLIQRYWVLADSQRRSGFETFYRLDDNTYHLSSAILTGHYLTSLIEATLVRQP